MNELTLMAVGVYGKEGPAQNGAPIRLQRISLSAVAVTLC